MAKTSRPARVTAAGAAAVLLTSTMLVTAAQGLAEAKAVPAPVWTRLSTGPGVSISSEPTVTRWKKKLVVGWLQGESVINSRLLGSNAKTIGGINPVVTGWNDLDVDPQLAVIGGKPTLAFHGAHSDVTGDPYTGPVLYAQATNGATWATGAGSLTQSPLGSSSFGLGLADDGTGQPIIALAGAPADHITVHHGIDPAVPAATPDTEGPNVGETQDVSLARDAKTGIAYAAWYSSLQGATQGIHFEEVYPTVGPPSKAAPGSLTKYSGQLTSLNPNQSIAIAARVGGGVWAAYEQGYVGSYRLVLYNVVTGRTLSMSRGSNWPQYINLSAAPGGRLWVSWVEGTHIVATRTNPSVTAFGVVRTVASPTISGSAPTRTAGDGALGPLDTVINTIGKGDHDAKGNLITELYSTRILEGLAVHVSPAVISYAKGGTLTVTVSDAGVLEPGAKVAIGSVVKVTNAQGQAVFALPARTAKGSHAVTVTQTGWWPGSAVFKVR
ncbi:hypothetical protein acdb102_13190 [Acidothermaceae bacterium B102]|nr:hypothetical protein acdb102_13190 [Acidothermaceae bacterium B102]